MRHLCSGVLVFSLFLASARGSTAAAGDDFKPIFNGTDLSGWEAVGGPVESWGVADGVLFTTGEGGGWLSTAQEYANYELRLEFKVPADGNSGVFIRAPREGSPWIDGMEIQLLDDYAEKHANLEPYQYCASLYGISPAQPRVSKKAGEWQKMSVLCDGSKVHISLNGETVVDTDLAEHSDKAEKLPGVKRPQGFIGLQNHGSRLDFKNIEIRTLP